MTAHAAEDEQVLVPRRWLMKLHEAMVQMQRDHAVYAARLEGDDAISAKLALDIWNEYDWGKPKEKR